MTCTSRHHHELTNGVGKCSVPMWMGGCPAGFCDEPAYGVYIEGPRYAQGPKRGERLDNKYNGFVSGLACPRHGGPEKDGPRVFVDGTDRTGRQMWCAVYPDFEDLQASPAEFHTAPWVAIEMLLKNHPQKSTR